MRALRRLLVLFAFVGLTLPAAASGVLLPTTDLRVDFDDVPLMSIQTELLDFYDGGANGNGDVGPSLGLVFTEGAYAFAAPGFDMPSGTQGLFLGAPMSNPGASGVMTWGMGLRRGFNDSVGFAYFVSQEVEVRVYSQYDPLDPAAGLLGSMLLSPTVCASDIDCWRVASISFAGLAHVMTFTGAPGTSIYDSFYFADVVAIPEPASTVLMALGIALFVLGRYARRRD